MFVNGCRYFTDRKNVIHYLLFEGSLTHEHRVRAKKCEDNLSEPLFGSSGVGRLCLSISMMTPPRPFFEFYPLEHMCGEDSRP